ncbi:MAG: hypothetical protein AAGK22_26685, partial [Acidobacteriota bacterium]
VDDVINAPSALYRVDGTGGISMLLRTGDSVAGLTLDRILQLEASSELLAILVSSSSGAAVLVWDQVAGFSAIVDGTTVLPGQSVPFTVSGLPWSSPLSVSDRRVAFVHNDLPNVLGTVCSGGAYLWESGMTQQVVGNQDRHPELGDRLECFYSVYLGESEFWLEARTFTVTATVPPYANPGDLLAVRGDSLVRVRPDRLVPSPWEGGYRYRPILQRRRALLWVESPGPFPGGPRGVYEVSLGSLGVPIPTLSEAGFILTILLVAALGMRFVRRL